LSTSAVDIIRDGVARITAAMAHGHFSKDDLLTVKKIFETSIKITDECLARGSDNKGTA